MVYYCQTFCSLELLLSFQEFHIFRDFTYLSEILEYFTVRLRATGLEPKGVDKYDKSVKRLKMLAAPPMGGKI